MDLGADYGKVLFGQHAVHVPMWMWVRHQGTQDGDTIVSFVGASRVTGAAHPLRYGSERTHQLVVGELLVRPHVVLGTDEHRGYGLAGLANRGSVNIETLMEDGDLVLDIGGRASQLRERWREA